MGAARGRRDGGGAAQLREGGLGAEPLGVVTGGHQQLPGGVDPDPGQGDQGRGDRGDQQLELAVELGELGLELLPAPSRVRRLALVAAIGLVRGPGRSAAQTPNQGLVLSPSSGCRSSSGALCSTPYSCSAAATRAFIAPRRATRSTRIISTWPSRVLGTVVATPARVDRAAAWASIGSDLPCRRRRVRSGRFTSTTCRP